MHKPGFHGIHKWAAQKSFLIFFTTYSNQGWIDISGKLLALNMIDFGSSRSYIWFLEHHQVYFHELNARS